jgi:predicted PurR-regulated permease PerM
MNKVVRRLASQLGWDRNPLRRRVDRAEAAVMTALLAVFLIGAPVLMIVAARVTDSAGTRQQHAERAWREVPATLLQTAANQADPSYGWGGVWVSARWRAPDGQRRTGLVAVGPAAVAGQHVPVWVDAAGRLTSSPLSSYDVWGNVVLAAVTVPIVLAVALSVVVGCVRIVLNRRRLAGWDRAWCAVGPRWTRLP